MPPKALPTRKSTVKDGGRRMGHFLPGGVCCFLGTEAHARKREVQHGSILTNLNSFGGRGITPHQLKLSRNSNDRSDSSVRSSDSFKVTRRDLMIVGATAIAARAAPAVLWSSQSICQPI
jgi:hypothetical protein